MKKAILFASIAALFISSSVARTWTSADGSKTFEGTLRSYDKNSGKVQVILENGRAMTFQDSVLSGEDREFLLLESAKNTPAGEQDFTEELEKTKVGKMASKAKLKLLERNRFKTAELDKAPEYYIIYFSASW